MNQPVIKAFVCFIFVLLTSSAATAKLKVAVVVAYSDEKISRELEDAIDARINSTERYSVTSIRDSGVDLVLEVDCVKVAGTTVCCSHVAYFPIMDLSVSEEMGTATGIASGPLDYIVDRLMDTFINGTANDKLEAEKAHLQKAIQYLCYLHPSECKLPAK